MNNLTESNQPRSYTKEEMREMFLYQCRTIAKYWSRVKDQTKEEMCDGVVFSILSVIDGGSGGFPCAIDLVLRPHPEDKDYWITEGENWVEDGQVINNVTNLHDYYFKRGQQ